VRPTLITLAARCFEKEIRLPKGSRLLIAVSGGPDSMALLHAVARLRPRLDVHLSAHGVDHGLRKEAKKELDKAEALAESLEVPFTRTRVRVAPGGNLQARARAARYEALWSAAGSETFLATAHHADDRAETVLIRLLRGAGPAELAVLPARSGKLLRPLVRARRADIESHLTRYKIATSSDPSNDDRHFLRTRVRKDVLPLLSGLDPQIVKHLCALADRLGAISRGEEGGAHIYPLPQATQTALAELARNPRARSRILLPGGIVATSFGTQSGRTRI
jgi:tRNA(Ile)-lysidine synthase